MSRSADETNQMAWSSLDRYLTRRIDDSETPADVVEALSKTRNFARRIRQNQAERPADEVLKKKSEEAGRQPVYGRVSNEEIVRNYVQEPVDPWVYGVYGAIAGLVAWQWSVTIELPGLFLPAVGAAMAYWHGTDRRSSFARAVAYEASRTKD